MFCFVFAVTSAPSDGETGRTHEDTFGVSFLFNDVDGRSVNSAAFRFHSHSSVLVAEVSAMCRNNVHDAPKATSKAETSVFVRLD